MSHNNKKNIIFSLDPDYSLSKNIVKHLDLELSPIKVDTFADGEVFCQPLVSVRNKNVFIIQTFSKPVNENIMKLLVAIDAFKRAAVKQINVVIPYFAYARQDRKTQGRSPISSKLLADLITTAGADRLILVELHSDQIQGFFNVPIDHLLTIYSIAEYIKSNLDISKATIVAPDFGAIKKARNLSSLLNLPLAIIDKRRETPNKSESLHVFGDVENKDCIVIDDIIDTGGTIIGASTLLKKFGAKNVYICATHGLFNGNAFKNFMTAYKENMITKVFVTNTVEISAEYDFLKIMDISPFIAEIIKIYIVNEGSVSDLYAKYRTKITGI